MHPATLPPPSGLLSLRFDSLSLSILVPGHRDRHPGCAILMQSYYIINIHVSFYKDGHHHGKQVSGMACPAHNLYTRGMGFFESLTLFCISRHNGLAVLMVCHDLVWQGAALKEASKPRGSQSPCQPIRVCLPTLSRPDLRTHSPISSILSMLSGDHKSY